MCRAKGPPTGKLFHFKERQQNRKLLVLADGRWRLCALRGSLVPTVGPAPREGHLVTFRQLRRHAPLGSAVPLLGTCPPRSKWQTLGPLTATVVVMPTFADSPGSSAKRGCPPPPFSPTACLTVPRRRTALLLGPPQDPVPTGIRLGVLARGGRGPRERVMDVCRLAALHCAFCQHGVGGASHSHFIPVPCGCRVTTAFPGGSARSPGRARLPQVQRWPCPELPAPEVWGPEAVRAGANGRLGLGPWCPAHSPAGARHNE